MALSIGTVAGLGAEVVFERRDLAVAAGVHSDGAALGLGQLPSFSIVVARK